MANLVKETETHIVIGFFGRFFFLGLFLWRIFGGAATSSGSTSGRSGGSGTRANV